MKKISILSTLILFTTLGLTIFIIGSCSKKTDEVVNAKETFKGSGAILSHDDSVYVQRLSDFDSKLQPYISNSNYTSNNKYLLDDAVWNVEAYFNAKYARNMGYFLKSEMKKDTVTFSINSSDYVMVDDIVDYFKELYNINYAIYTNCSLSNKKFMLTDLKVIEHTQSYAKVEITTYIGSQNLNPGQPTGYNGQDYFDVDDYWYYGQYKGDCDLSVIEDGLDAAVKISEAIFSTAFITDDNCDCIKWSDLTTTDLVGNEYQDDNNNYLLFYIQNTTGVFTSAEKCLEPDEMNFHFHGTWEVIDNLEQSLNLQYAYTHFIEGISDTKNNYYRLRHHSTFTHGKRHCLPSSLCPEILDISIKVID